ncbi:MAG: 3-dehydroquinate synthase [Bacteroidetes bacterium]|nr:3-dehydroquinate synthase [Bacteroidota bacterium]
MPLLSKSVSVRLRPSSGDRSYRIAIQPGILGSLADRKTKSEGKVFIITDETVGRLYGRAVQKEFVGKGNEAVLLDFPPGERSKNYRTVNALHTQLLRNGIGRDSLIVALGGGVVGDVAGYVAATILRGVPFIQVPTTLLAQVDSSVGGKVGIDHPLGKNLIGAFHQPTAVYIDPDVLRTLSIKEYRNGLAEVVKIAAALDRRFFNYIEQQEKQIRKRNPRVVLELIHRAVTIKAAVVMKDEKEAGLRKVLNLGHTIGHAVEAATDFRLKHGEAVAIGLATEARIALEMGVMMKKEYERLVALLGAFRLPIRFPSRMNTRRFLAALSADKKGEGGRTKFVLLKRIGQPVVGVEVPSPFIVAMLRNAYRNR